MATYKAKKSYSELKDSDNFLSLGSASKHIWLMSGDAIDCSFDIPEKLKKHLEEVKSPSKKKEDK